MNGKLYALPFYGESSFTFYRKDLFDKAGVTMPENPTYADIDKILPSVQDRLTPPSTALPARQAGLGREHGLLRHRW